MQAKIRFGTDGWRGVIAEDFTFERVRLVTAALAETLPPGGTVIVGFDRRFLSPDFARAVTETLAGAGLKVLLSRAFVPTPAISLAVRNRGAAAGVVITASHNPPRWNGFKVKETFGGSARTATTAALEKAIARRAEEKTPLPRMSLEEARCKGTVEDADLGESYLEALKSLVDLEAIGRTDWRVFVDPIHGSGTGFLARILAEAGVDVAQIRGDDNPCFGGVNPEPIEENLQALAATMKAAGPGSPRIGLALDGDADRIGAFDEEIHFFDSHRIFASLFRHLVKTRNLPGSVVQTVSSTVMVRRLAEKLGRQRLETPIGFKHIVEHMLGGGVLIGGEESGGLGFGFHLPERDGTLSGLLLLEACAQAGMPPRALLSRIFDEVGVWEYARVDVHLDPARAAEIVGRVRSAMPRKIAGARVAGRDDRDGVKFLFEDDSWLLLRPSGTEPVLRIYSEAGSRARVEELLGAGQTLALSPG